MLQIIIQHLLCSAVFLAIYFLFLQKQKTLVFNRYYLLVSLLLSVVIPFVNIPIPVLQAAPETISNPVFINFTEEFATILTQPVEAAIDWKYWSLLIMYFIGVALLLAKLIYGIYAIYKQKKNAAIKSYQKAVLVLTEKTIVPHSFLNSIYLNKYEFEKADFPAAILTHEYAHIQQKHSFDILFTAFLQTALWFNPLIYFYTKAIKLNHEFLADEAVVKQEQDISNYQYLLLNLPIQNLHGLKLISPMNFITTKNRFMMMTKKQNQLKAMAAKSFTLLLTISIAVALSVKLVAQDKKKGKKEVPYVEKEVKISKEGFKPLDFTYTVIPDATTNPLLLEFQQIVNKTGSYKVYEKDTAYFFSIPYEIRKRVDYIFNHLTKAEIKQTKLIVWMITLGIPKKVSPTEEQFENFKNANQYGVWIDGKKVPNEKLNEYKASDFVYFFSSKLYGNAQKGKSYSIQVDLSTDAYFKECWKEKKQVKEFTFTTGHEKKKWRELITLKN